jgi:hypothetical protein
MDRGDTVDCLVLSCLYTRQRETRDKTKIQTMTKDRVTTTTEKDKTTITTGKPEDNQKTNTMQTQRQPRDNTRQLHDNHKA